MATSKAAGMFQVVRYRLVFLIVSRILFALAAGLLLNIGVAIILIEDPFPFLYAFITVLVSGLLMNLKGGFSMAEAKLQRKEAYMTVTVSWFLMCIAGALPYLYSGTIPGFSDAIFESVSGFTTTGASILTDIEALPGSILFWRSLTHWIGGIGIIVLLLTVMQSTQIAGYKLFNLESSLQEKFKPKIRTVATRLITIYIILTGVEIILLVLGKMSIFESICHAFGTVSTGGFSPKNTSIASYSPYLQYVIMVFMFLSGANFMLHYFVLKGEFRRLRDNDEFRFYAGVTMIIGMFVTVSLAMFHNKDFGEAFREGFFQVISILTCTGFVTADYLQWPAFLWITIFLIMFIGGCTGSTAGGIKMARFLVLGKNISFTIKKLVHPNGVIPIRLNNKSLSVDANQSILTFISVYIMLFTFASLVLIAHGVDIKTSASAVATCMANIGPGIGSVGPVSNFGHLSDSVKIILSAMMIIGRLEIYTILVMFTRTFWKE